MTCFHAVTIGRFGLTSNDVLPLDDGLWRRQVAGMSDSDAGPTPEEYQKAVGLRLRWVRDAAGQSQAEVARLLRMDQSTWSKWELGERMPDPYKLLVFCARYRVNMGYVFEGVLDGLHPGLRRLLETEHPELRPATKGTEPDMDTIRDAYRATIRQ